MTTEKAPASSVGKIGGLTASDRPENQPYDLDVCRCGDYRRDHQQGAGTCKLNGLGHGMLGYSCAEFRIHQFSPVNAPANE